MAGNEVGFRDIVWRTNGVITKAQVANCDAAGLLGVILKVRLHILISVIADDLDRVLVGANRTIAAEAPELALDGTRS